MFLAQHGERFDLHFLLVGETDRCAMSCWRKRTDKGVAHRFTVTGVVERDDVARHVAAFDIALQPGITEYASPLKLFEYMYLARAIVAPASANIREILTDGRDALLFDSAQADSLEAALLRLCEDQGLRARLGQQARQTIADKSLTWSANAETVVRLAETLVAHRAGGRADDVSFRKLNV